MGLRRLRISTHFIAQLLKGSDELSITAITDRALPDDAEVVALLPDAATFSVVALIRSGEWADTDAGAAVPEVDPPTFKRWVPTDGSLDARGITKIVVEREVAT